MLILGTAIGLLGMVLGSTSPVEGLEENFGLDLLFRLRGTRPPPPEVSVVAIDRESSDRLGLPNDPRRWARTLHARLTDRLSAAGAAVVVFDIIFEEPRTPPEDGDFAKSLRAAGNVILCQFVRVGTIPLNGAGGADRGSMGVLRLVSPTPELAEAAQALSPFPLPKIPAKVSRYWAFYKEGGGIPTLPVVAYHLFARQEFDRYLLPVKEEMYDRSRGLPAGVSASLVEVIRGVRETFENHPATGMRLRGALEEGGALTATTREARAARSLLRLYVGPDSRYLNFYGPPRTIPTFSYDQVLAGSPPVLSDLRGKVVFVGISETVQPEQKDGHNTVFTRPDGLDLSGVEIAATALGNLLDDLPVQPLRPWAALAMSLAWGAALGAICILFPPLRAGLAVVALSALYLGVAVHRFTAAGAWHPLVVPLLLQAPLAYLGAVLWRYADAKAERHAMRRTFEYYLPNDVIDQLTRDVKAPAGGGRLVYGVCLSTDAERYTEYSEALSPQELAAFMNAYYESLFRPVQLHGGVVSNVVADSMLALWVTKEGETDLREKACLAALEIVANTGVDRGPAGTPRVVTRVGLHSGEILLGNLGAMGRYEYRPVGDIVNTATRIEGLNKHLGTHLLASEEVVGRLNGFHTREVGAFRLAGKGNSIVLYEVMGRAPAPEGPFRDTCERFAEGLSAFRRRAWDEAIDRFREAMERSGGDGPSRFYLELCARYKASPPDESRDGVVVMEKK